MTYRRVFRDCPAGRRTAPPSGRGAGGALSRRQWLWGVGAAAWAGAVAPRSAFGQTRGAAPEHSAAALITPAADAAITRGLEFLRRRQQPDGGMGTTVNSRRIAVCALSGLAWLAAGSTPGRGPYGESVNAAVAYLLDNMQETGFLSIPATASHGPMYSHGFGTLFLAEVYGMSARADLRPKLDAAVKLILSSQNEEGGWRYEPRPLDADISVTICQIMALRAARNAGLAVPKDTVERCIGYVKRCQNPDGGFMYMSSGGPSDFPRSAAGVVALYSAGIYEGPEIEKGLEYLIGFLPGSRGPHGYSHYYYAHYYAVQAMWHAGGDYWRRWYPAIRDELLERQAAEGSWPDSYSAEYGTAMATIILQTPNCVLPIFQR